VLEPVEVSIQDASGRTAESVTMLVTIALGANPGGGTLSGTRTVNAVNGVATFTDLSIDEPGTGYTLVASAGALPDVTSGTFDILFVSPLTVGVVHACTVTSAGGAYCWGLNNHGQLGDGTTTNRTTPVAVTGDIVFASIEGGVDHTCGLTAAGEAYCWGRNNVGQVGDSTVTRRLEPVLVVGDHTFVAIDVGWDHTCGVSSTSRDAYCWGYNNTGQLGDGTRLNTSVPVVTFGASLLGFTSVNAGGRHSCALAPNGTAYCWGLNHQGQVGDDTKTTRFIPTAVSGGHTFQSLAINNDPNWESTCGVTRENEAYCWGLNNYGQLGSGTTGGDATVPMRVFGGLAFAVVSAGRDHSCGVTTTGEAYCWGRNEHGQLGNGLAGGDQGRNTPTLVTGDHAFRYVAAGQSFSCGITLDDEIYCWGRNHYGQLGIGSTASSSEPVLVTIP
jgi:alpha-tubulin suppressor-like RCC1 family protein